MLTDGFDPRCRAGSDSPAIRRARRALIVAGSDNLRPTIRNESHSNCRTTDPLDAAEADAEVAVHRDRASPETRADRLVLQTAKFAFECVLTSRAPEMSSVRTQRC